MVNQGDIIKVCLDPQSGSEQAGFRPAVVVSNERLNRVSRVILACPVTNFIRNYPTHVLLPESLSTTGEIMCEQIKALDLTVRPYRLIEKLPQETLQVVLETIQYIVEKCD